MGFDVHPKIEIIGILEVRSPATHDKWSDIMEFRRIPDDDRKVVLFFDTFYQGFNNLPGKGFLFMYTCCWDRGNDKTTVRCKAAIGFGKRKEAPFLADYERTAANEHIIPETPENFEGFSIKISTRVEPGSFMKNGSLRRLPNEFVPL